MEDKYYGDLRVLRQTPRLVAVAAEHGRPRFPRALRGSPPRRRDRRSPHAPRSCCAGPSIPRTSDSRPSGSTTLRGDYRHDPRRRRLGARPCHPQTADRLIRRNTSPRGSRIRRTRSGVSAAWDQARRVPLPARGHSPARRVPRQETAPSFDTGVYGGSGRAFDTRDSRGAATGLLTRSSWATPAFRLRCHGTSGPHARDARCENAGPAPPVADS